MTAKRATLRLYVALTGLLASLLELTGALVRLATSAVQRVTPKARPETTTVPWTPQAPTWVQQAAPVAPPQDEKLHGALVGMGFRAGSVRKFTASVQGRTEPLEVLIKEGIVALSAN
jgi:hypothetical protein